MRPIVHSRKQNKNSAKMFFVFALLLIIFFSASPSSFRSVEGILTMAAVPFWNTGTPPNGVLSSRAELTKENEDLRNQISILKRNLKGYDFVVQENIEFRELFVGKQTGGIFAGVITHPGSLPFDVFLLDVGSTSGIFAQKLVLVDQNIVIGKVVEVFPYSAKVKAFSSPGEVTDVFLGPNNIPAELKGVGGGAYTAELPRDLDVQEGDAAVFPGTEGFILGYVESKEENLTDSFQKLYLRSPVNVFELKYAQIISPLVNENEP